MASTSLIRFSRSDRAAAGDGQLLAESANIAEWYEAQIHRYFTCLADDQYGYGTIKAQLEQADHFIDAWLQAKAEEAERKRVAARASDQAMKPL